jgi:anti-sigma factor RsiW
MMTNDRLSKNQGDGCSACWDALIAGPGESGSRPVAVDAHLAECPACRARLVEAERLAGAMSALADRIDADASAQSGQMQTEATVSLLLRLARYEALHKRARRAFAASVGVAASVTLVVGLLLATGEGQEAHQPTPGLIPEGSALVDSSVGASDQGNPYDTGASSAIPVQGWIDLPSSEISADSTIWWVVLNYGGR